ncbi:hypothetical protein [Bradyrhizobium sp. STM 3809]|uniref:hypothetical protein n=1 Tax=Bradyrhizobium sp. STM 3809 TaxID=551936 RepID=UPI0002409D7E|nr:hypothetical protein [Bradyrhizobium sp. STM 3809]CCE01935.1 conserved hypothetical protein [Bradyrhizobium sp. STM 3809]
MLATVVSGCSSTPDFLSKDAEWFNRPQRLFIRNISIDAPPLSPDKPVSPEDFVSADGGCPGMAPAAGAAGANALASDAAATPPAATGTVALGHTECDVVRGIGAPDSVNIGNEGGERVATVTWLRGPRAGVYTFTAGRLSAVERAPDAGPAPKIAKPGKAKKRAT